MLIVVFRRRLRQGATFEEFIEAWEADKGFGVPARVFNSVAVDDPREILSVGFVDIDAGDLAHLTAGVADQEQVQHDRIDEVIESTELRAFYQLRTEHDFSGDPKEIELMAAESLLSALS